MQKKEPAGMKQMMRDNPSGKKGGEPRPLPGWRGDNREVWVQRRSRNMEFLRVSDQFIK